MSLFSASRRDTSHSSFSHLDAASISAASKVYIRSFSELSNSDVPLVGGKNASLGEMYNSLTPLGIRIPHGFAVTASAYQLLLQQPFECAPPPNKTRMLARDAETVGDAINNVMSHLVDVEDTAMLADVGKACRCIIANAPIPEELEAVIALASAELRAKYGDTAITVAVRSSATAEDLPTASFAGQHDSYLNVHPKGAALLTAIRSCFASLYTDRAIRCKSTTNHPKHIQKINH